MTDIVRSAIAFSEAASDASATISGVFPGAPIASRTDFSLPRLRPAIAHLSELSVLYCRVRYSATSWPVKPVAP